MLPSTAVTIGAFDGVHLGHAALVAAARDAVGDRGRVVALCFEPHPMAVLRPDAAPARLSTFRQRSRWLRDAGADEVIPLEPSDSLLGKSPRSFLEWVVAEYACTEIVEGPDFRFGRDRAGSIETLRELAPTLGYRAIEVDAVHGTLTDGSVVKISSSIVRWLVNAGRGRDAARLLGPPYGGGGPVGRGTGGCVMRGSDERGRSGSEPIYLVASGIASSSEISPTTATSIGASRQRRSNHFCDLAID